MTGYMSFICNRCGKDLGVFDARTVLNHISRHNAQDKKRKGQKK